jgi:ParB family transcriptional regulator, chromosome partitioning protein
MADLKTTLASKLAEDNVPRAGTQPEAAIDNGRRHVTLHVERIDANPYQPRSLFDPDEIEDLAASIEEVGLLQPISVRPVPGERYQLIAGERRLRAHRYLGRATIEAIVIPVEEADMAVLAMVENIDREDLTDYEIGKALRRLEAAFPTKTKLAEAMGINREDMYRYFAFEALPEYIHARLEKNPRLLSRAAAADIKRVLQQSTTPATTGALLDSAWNLLEAGDLEQSKIAAFMQPGDHPMPVSSQKPSVTTTATVAETVLFRAGRKVGTIRCNQDALVVKLKKTVLTPQQMERLRAFLEALVAERV